MRKTFEYYFTPYNKAGMVLGTETTHYLYLLIYTEQSECIEITLEKRN